MRRFSCPTMPAGRFGGLLGGVLGGLLGVGLIGCKDPPEVDRVTAPKIDADKAKALADEAYRDALTAALPSVRAVLAAADPLAAYQIGMAPAASPPLTRQDRRALDARLGPVDAALGEIDESHLPGAEVVILRVMRFALGRLNDDLHRRSISAEDPSAALRLIDANLDELRYRLLHDDCDEVCEALPAALADDVRALPGSLGAASLETVAFAAGRARELDERARTLANNALVSERAQLRAGLDELARACAEHALWLDELPAKLELATLRAWAAPQVERSESEPVARLPAVIGRDALVRRFSAEERVDLQAGPAFAEIERMVRRWETMRATLVPADTVLPKPAHVDAPRCEAALARLTAGFAEVDEVDAPVLDCTRYVALLDGQLRDEGELLLELLDWGVIEPQRRKLRATELPEVALVSGQWSTQVHTHLMRVMLLARLSEPAAALHALSEGRRALCWAEAALWIHAELGPAQEVALTVGGPCEDLGDAATITAHVSADPRGALAGFGLSLIGDEPARMVGFDRFFWAPLGAMKLLATPRDMHPDSFSLPDDPVPAPARPEPKVEFERL